MFSRNATDHDQFPNNFLATIARSSFFSNNAIKFYHQQSLQDRKNKTIYFSLYVILSYSNFKQQLMILRDQKHLQISRDLVKNKKYKIVLVFK